MSRMKFTPGSRTARSGPERPFKGNSRTVVESTTSSMLDVDNCTPEISDCTVTVSATDPTAISTLTCMTSSTWRTMSGLITDLNPTFSTSREKFPGGTSLMEWRPPLLDSERVGPGRDVLDVIESTLVRQTFKLQVCFFADEPYSCIRDDCLGGVRDPTGQGRIGSLGFKHACRRKNQNKTDANHFAHRTYPPHETLSLTYATNRRRDVYHFGGRTQLNGTASALKGRLAETTSEPCFSTPDGRSITCGILRACW